MHIDSSHSGCIIDTPRAKGKADEKPHLAGQPHAVCVLWFSRSAAAAAAAAAKLLQSFPTLCDPIDGSPPGSAVPGILQARTLEWVAIPSPMHESEK